MSPLFGNHEWLFSSSVASRCWGGLGRSLSVVSQGLWQLYILLAFIFQSALTAVPFAILASVNHARPLGGRDQTAMVPSTWQGHTGPIGSEKLGTAAPQQTGVCQPSE